MRADPLAGPLVWKLLGGKNGCLTESSAPDFSNSGACVNLKDVLS